MHVPGIEAGKCSRGLSAKSGASNDMKRSLGSMQSLLRTASATNGQRSLGRKLQLSVAEAMNRPSQQSDAVRITAQAESALSRT